MQYRKRSNSRRLIRESRQHRIRRLRIERLEDRRVLAIYAAPFGAGGSWNVYEVVDQPATWIDAHNAAESSTFDGQSGHLVSIHSDHEHNYLLYITPTINEFWLGLTDSESYGGVETGSDPLAARPLGMPGNSPGWVWTSGETYSYERFRNGEPNDFNNGTPGEDAVTMFGNRWLDRGNGLEGQADPIYPYIVEYETHYAAPPDDLPLSPHAAALPRREYLPTNVAVGWEDSIGVTEVKAGLTAANIHEAVFKSRFEIQRESAAVVKGMTPGINNHDPFNGFTNPSPIGADSRPFLTDTPTRDDNVQVLYAGTIVVGPEQAGVWTFAFQSGDAMALQIEGATFSDVYGNGLIDPMDRSAIIHPGRTGNSLTFGIVELEAGNYNVTSFYSESLGVSYASVFTAPGAYKDLDFTPVGSAETAPQERGAEDPVWRGLGEPNGVLLDETPGFTELVPVADFFDVFWSLPGTEFTDMDARGGNLVAVGKSDVGTYGNTDGSIVFGEPNGTGLTEVHVGGSGFDIIHSVEGQGDEILIGGTTFSDPFHIGPAAFDTNGKRGFAAFVDSSNASPAGIWLVGFDNPIVDAKRLPDGSIICLDELGVTHKVDASGILVWTTPAPAINQAVSGGLGITIDDRILVVGTVSNQTVVSYFVDPGTGAVIDPFVIKSGGFVENASLVIDPNSNNVQVTVTTTTPSLGGVPRGEFFPEVHVLAIGPQGIRRVANGQSYGGELFTIPHGAGILAGDWDDSTTGRPRNAFSYGTALNGLGDTANTLGNDAAYVVLNHLADPVNPIGNTLTLDSSGNDSVVASAFDPLTGEWFIAVKYGANDGDFAAAPYADGGTGIFVLEKTPVPPATLPPAFGLTTASPTIASDVTTSFSIEGGYVDYIGKLSSLTKGDGTELPMTGTITINAQVDPAGKVIEGGGNTFQIDGQVNPDGVLLDGNLLGGNLIGTELVPDPGSSGTRVSFLLTAGGDEQSSGLFSQFPSLLVPVGTELVISVVIPGETFTWTDSFGVGPSAPGESFTTTSPVADIFTTEKDLNSPECRSCGVAEPADAGSSYPFNGASVVEGSSSPSPTSRGISFDDRYEYRSDIHSKSGMGNNVHSSNDSQVQAVTPDSLEVHRLTNPQAQVGDTFLIENGDAYLFTVVVPAPSPPSQSPADNNAPLVNMEAATGSFQSPAGHYTRLTLLPDGSYTQYDNDGTIIHYGVPTAQGIAKLQSRTDRNGNTETFHYNLLNQLTEVHDTLGRVNTYDYDSLGRLVSITDFSGRQTTMEYNFKNELVAVTTPPVIGTPNGNDFPDGQTTRYTYLDGHLLHTVTAPNEVANGGPPRETFFYDTLGRVSRIERGGTNETGVPAGGVTTFRYDNLGVMPAEGDFQTPKRQTTITDPRGNVTVAQFNQLNDLVLKREYTRGLRPGDPDFYETAYQKNGDYEETEVIHPEGNRIVSVYDTTNPDRRQQGNLLEQVRIADSRGGDQTEIKTTFTYEPIYNQRRTVTDPRGNDPTFVPPIGIASAARYSTTMTFDYQEGTEYDALGAKIGLSATDVQQLLVAAGIPMGLGDINGDGVTNQVNGNVIRIDSPTVTLLAGSNQAAVEGDTSQEIYQLMAYNQFGQITREVDAERNVTIYEYYPEQDPDGDGIINNPSGDAATGGYLKRVIRDTESDPNRNSSTDPTPVSIQTSYEYDSVGNIIRQVDGRGIAYEFSFNSLDQVVEARRATNVDQATSEPLPLTAFDYIQRTFYDANANIVRIQTEDRGDTSGVGGDQAMIVDFDLDGVAGLSDFNILRTWFGQPGGPAQGDSDGDGFVGLSDFNNLRTFFGTSGPVPETYGGTAFVDTVYKYDILDQRIQTVQEVNDDEDLITRYRYDAGGNQVLTIFPAGNASSIAYDERELLLRSTRGALTATPDTLLHPAADPTTFDVRGGTPCDCTTFRYDGNGNVIETVDSDDTDLSAANGSILGAGDRTRYIYDGFDRPVSVVDAVGNQSVTQYDPAGNVIRTLHFGPVGGASPVADGPAILPHPVSKAGVIQVANLVSTNLLAATEFQHDELNRAFQTDRVLFVNTIPTSRPVDVQDGADSIGKGNLTSGDNQAIPGVIGVTILGRVSSRTEYDRKSRTTHRVQDDGDTATTFYDGVDRTVGTIDPEGNTTEYAYDANHNLIETKETDVAQVAGVADEVFLTTYFYDSLNRLQSQTDNLGQTMTFRYDSRDNLVAMADAEGPMTGATIQRRAFSDGTLTQNVINDFGNVTVYYYDGLNRRTREERVLTAPRDQFVGASSGSNTATTFHDASVCFADDSLTGQVISITDGAGKSQTRKITGNSAMELSIDRPWDTVPDATSQYFVGGGAAQGDGRHIGASIFGIKNDPPETESFIPTPDVTQGGGDGLIRTGYTYDDNSLSSSLIDDQGNITLYLYDNLNRKITESTGLVTTSPLNRALILGQRDVVTPTAATIDNPGIIDRALLELQIADAKIRIDAIAALFPPLADDVAATPPPPKPTTVAIGYTPDDNAVIIEDENDTEVFTRYDAINRPIAVRVFRSEGSPATQAADSHVGDPLFAPNPISDPADHSPDPFPAVIGTTKQDFQYDGLSRLVYSSDNNDPGDTADDSTTTFAFDSLSRMVEETQQLGSITQIISSSYRAENLRSSLTYPNQRTVAYTYDDLDRLNTVTDVGAPLAIVDYDFIGTGRVLNRAYPQNGTRLTYLDDSGSSDLGYDGLRRPVQLRDLRNDNSLIVGFTHLYDRMNNKTTEDKLHSPENSEVYAYDAAYRLVNFQRPQEGAISPAQSEFDLDGVGNWQKVDGEARKHSSFNEILSRDTGNGPVTLTYDDNGNLTDDGALRYEWDFQNRLRRVTRDSDSLTIAGYTYDAMNRRVAKDVTNSGDLDGTTRFLYTGWQVLEERDAADELVQQYVYGLYIDEPLILDRNLDGGTSAIETGDQRLFYHQNSLFSVHALSDQDGDVVEAYLFDVFGEPTTYVAGDNGNVDFGGDDVIEPNSKFANSFLFMARKLDVESRLFHYRNRFYHTLLGRFISRDIMGAATGVNLYEFVGSRPTMFLDPLGLWSVEATLTHIIHEEFRSSTVGHRRTGEEVQVGAWLTLMGEVHIKSDGTKEFKTRDHQPKVGNGGSINYPGADDPATVIEFEDWAISWKTESEPASDATYGARGQGDCVQCLERSLTVQMEESIDGWKNLGLKFGVTASVGGSTKSGPATLGVGASIEGLEYTWKPWGEATRIDNPKLTVRICADGKKWGQVFGFHGSTPWDSAGGAEGLLLIFYPSPHAIGYNQNRYLTETQFS